MTKRTWGVVFLSLLLSLGVVTGGRAQVLTGTLTGTVTDPSDAVVPDANVTVLDSGTGQKYTTKTNSAGNFTIPNLPNGFFRVEVEAAGFAKAAVERVQVFVAQTAKVVVKLEIARAGTEVVVTAEQTAVQTESIELKNSIERAQIINLPLPTRNPLDLVRTMPGIVTPTSSGIADAFVHGLRGNSTNITQDGINVADNFVKTSSFFAISAPTVDTVGEFNVSIGGIGADAGFGAAQVNIRTERGGNDFHGRAFWFQRTNFLNANTFFNNAQRTPRPFQLQNRLGASAGGPVVIPGLYSGKNRTFVFGTYEAFREPLSRPRTRTVLTPSARQGQFTYTGTDGQRRTVNLLQLGTVRGGPATLNTAVMNFYNSLVPSDGLTDAGCGGGDTANIRCFAFNLPGKGIQDRYTLRFDHQLSSNHSIEFIWNQADFDSTPDLLNGIEPQFPKSPGGGQGSRRQVWAAAWHSTWGGNKTNELRWGMQRAPVGFNLYNDYSTSGGYQFDFSSVTDPTLVTQNLPQGRNTPVRQWTDNFAWVRGSHSWRFGGEFRQIMADNYFYNVVVPRIAFGSNSANPNGITAASFPGGISSGDLTRANNIFNDITGLLSLVQQGFNHTSPTSGFVKGVPRIFDPIQNNLSFYLQDSWKVRPNLTLQYGTRWEYQGPFDVRNRLVLLPQDGLSGLYGPAGLGNLFNPVATPVMNDSLLNFAGGRNGRLLHQRDINNFAPFFGFAWDPFQTGKTSIRGSFNSHYTQDGFTAFSPAATGNAGLFSVLSNNVAVGVYNASTIASQAPATPTAVFPASQKANFAGNTGQALWAFDESLKTPYVLGWTLGVQRELWNRWAFEARYVGNHAVKQFRSYSINELNLDGSTGLLAEFVAAQNNLRINQAAGVNSFANTGRPGQAPLPIFDRLFAGLPAGSGYGFSTFITQLNQNQIGTMFDTIRRSATYRANREANFPLNFFVPNPWANGAILLDNSGWSYYHGFETELNRRFSSGLFLQGNYTFSKVLTDTNFLTSQQENQNYRSLRNRRLDKNRAAFDITHSFAMNFLYPLPFGKGKWLGGGVNAGWDAIIGGWSLQGTTRWSSGAPFTITSGRATTGSLIGQPAVIRNMTAAQLKDKIGVFRGPSGVYWLDPASGLFTITGSSSRAVLCTAGQTTPCFDHPGTNQYGTIPFLGLDAPRFFNQDLSMIKRIRVPKFGERFNVELRLEAFNVFNNANFGTLQTGIDGTTFGQMTSTVDTVRGGGVTSRLVQWALLVNF
jgi:hypothetical protein